MNDEKILQTNKKLQKLRSMMSRIQAAHSDRGATLPSYDLSNGRKENQYETTAPIVQFNDYREEYQYASTAPVTHSNDNSKTTNVISVLFRSVEPIPYDPNVDADPDVCFNCRKKGMHRYKECTLPKIYKYCLNCGRRGVYVQDCPRCYKAHREFERSRRPVEQLPPQKSIERKREKSRARSRARNLEVSESREFREKSRQRQNYEWTDLKDSRGVGFSNGERRSRERRNPARDSRGAERKSREGKNPVRFNINDSHNSSGAGYSNVEMMNREERNLDWDSYAQDDNSSDYEEECNNNEKLEAGGVPVKDFTSEFHELMAAIRHLPNETQAELIEYFVKERQALTNTQAERNGINLFSVQSVKYYSRKN